MSKGIVLGIDFSADYTQMSVLGESGEPESLEITNVGNEYLMPSAMFYNTQLDEWAVGIEAINRSRVEEGEFIDNLPQRMVDSKTITIKGEKIEWSKIAAKYFQAVITIAINKVNGAMLKNIVISVDDPDENIMQALHGAMEELGYENGTVRIINHAESYAYYVLNQSRDIWVNSVLMVDFNEVKPVIRRMFVTKGREPYNVDVKKIDISDKIQYSKLDTEEDSREMDDTLSELLEKEIEENVVSAIYLNGQGFMKEGWYNKTIETVCNNRRIFAGNNLIVKGAVYAGKEFFCGKSLEQFVISCKGRTKVNVYMDVIHKGTDTKVVLSKAGTHWFEAGKKAQCIVDNIDKAHFTIVWPATKETKEFDISLKGFPKRKNKTVRVEVSISYTNENTLVVEIKDIGFGEFYESTGAVATYQADLRGNDK